MSKTLNIDLLCHAYTHGFFPMPDPDTDEIMWYNPDPRAIIPLDTFHLSRSLKRSISNRGYRVSVNEDFDRVMRACSERKDTWINNEFLRAYQQMHKNGHAHSIEVWHEQKLVGGLYGVSFKGAFFAESKFHTMRDASKVALAHLVERLRAKGMTLLEVQFLTPHLESLGAVAIPASEYQKKLADALALDVRFQ